MYADAICQKRSAREKPVKGWRLIFKIDRLLRRMVIRLKSGNSVRFSQTRKGWSDCLANIETVLARRE